MNVSMVRNKTQCGQIYLTQTSRSTLRYFQATCLPGRLLVIQMEFLKNGTVKSDPCDSFSLRNDS